MLQMSKLQKKITKFSIEGHTTSNIGETKSQKLGGFFCFFFLNTHKKAVCVCKYGHARERGKKDFWGAKRPRKGLVIVLLAVGLFLSSLRPFFVDLALKEGMFL